MRAFYSVKRAFPGCALALSAVGLTMAAITPARAQTHVVVQAEDFVSTMDFIDMANPGFLVMTDDPFASGGAYITTGRNQTVDPPDIIANYEIDFPTADPYHLYTRGKAVNADGGNDSYWLPSDFGTPAPAYIQSNDWAGMSRDNNEFYVWHNNTTNMGLGENGGSANNAAGPYIPFSTGVNDFEIGAREDGFRIDAFVFSTDDSLAAADLDALVGSPREARFIGGQAVIDRQTLSGSFANETFLPPQTIEQSLNFEIRTPGGYGFNDRASFEDFRANTPPALSGIMAAPILWGGSDYPDEWQSIFPDGVNQEQYSVTITGQMFINADFIEFKDGNDDFALFVIDEDGDGDLSNDATIIDDVQWTNLATTSNNGSPPGLAVFTNVPPEGEWRDFIFVFGEGTGGDNASLYWDQNPGFDLLPAQGVAVDQTGHRVPAEAFRVDGTAIIDTADLVADLSGETVVFDVKVHELEWDKVELNVPQIGGNPDADIKGVISFEDGIIRLELTEDPVPGLTVDLVDNDTFQQIIGPADFEFSHGDPAMWDTTQFATNGQIRFGGAPQFIVGDYNGNGTVEQADLDLVLLNWGEAFENLPAEWVNQRPTEGIVAQAQLDGVLLNWGNAAALGAAAAGVPEPASLAILLIAAGLGFGWLRKR